MDINIKISLGEQSIHNLAFVKALLIKYEIEKLNISHSQKLEIKKDILNAMKRLETR